MKPIIAMEGKKTVLPQFATDEAQEKPKRFRLIAGVATGLIALVVVTAIVVLAVHFGAKMTRDNYKEAFKTFQDGNGGVVDEKIEVKKDEVDITVPNEIKIIYDYKNGIEVYRMRDPETKTDGACYAKPLNHSQVDNIDTSATDKVATKADESVEIHYKQTTVRVPDYMISDNVREMCKGTEVYWIQRQDPSAITKRQTSDCIYISTTLYKLTYTDGYAYLYMKKYNCSGEIYYYWTLYRFYY